MVSAICVSILLLLIPASATAVENRMVHHRLEVTIDPVTNALQAVDVLDIEGDGDQERRLASAVTGEHDPQVAPIEPSVEGLVENSERAPFGQIGRLHPLPPSPAVRRGVPGERAGASVTRRPSLASPGPRYGLYGALVFGLRGHPLLPVLPVAVLYK